MVALPGSVVAQSPPVISSITPTSGSAGSAVTITGSNFSATPDNNVVDFSKVRLAVRAALMSCGALILGTLSLMAARRKFGLLRKRHRADCEFPPDANSIQNLKTLPCSRVSPRLLLSSGRLGWRLEPVLDLQTGDAIEMPHVAGHERQAPVVRGAGQQNVLHSEVPARPGLRRQEIGGGQGVVHLEREDSKPGNHLALNSGPQCSRVGRAGCAETQFKNNHGINEQTFGSLRLESSQYIWGCGARFTNSLTTLVSSRNATVYRRVTCLCRAAKRPCSRISSKA